MEIDISRTVLLENFSLINFEKNYADFSCDILISLFRELAFRLARQLRRNKSFAKNTELNDDEGRQNKKEKEKKKRKEWQGRVRLSWSGCEQPPIHRCYPTTVWRGSFCLLCFHPGPVRSSLTNLENSDSSVFTILTPNLARTPDLHRTTTPRNPALKPFSDPSLQAAGLQTCATTPGWWNELKFMVSMVVSLDCPPEVKVLTWKYFACIYSLNSQF